ERHSCLRLRPQNRFRTPAVGAALVMFSPALAESKNAVAAAPSPAATRKRPKLVRIAQPASRSHWQSWVRFGATGRWPGLVFGTFLPGLEVLRRMVVEEGLLLVCLVTEQKHDFGAGSHGEVSGQPDLARHLLLFEFHARSGFDA